MTSFHRFDMTTLKPHLRGIPWLITVERKSPNPLYRQIYDSFRTKIMDGELRGGEPVPSTRELARGRGIPGCGRFAPVPGLS